MRPYRGRAQIVGDVTQVRRDPPGVEVELRVRRVGSLVEQLPRPLEPVRLVIREMDHEVVAALNDPCRTSVRRLDQIRDADDPGQLIRLALQRAEPAAEQSPAVEREYGRAHVQRHRPRLVAQSGLGSGQPPVQGERVRVQIAPQVADLRRECHFPPDHLGRHPRREGQIEDVRGDLVGPQLPLDRVDLEGLAGGTDAVQVPGGPEQVVVDGAALDEQRDLSPGEASLELLGRREHASLAERRPQEAEVQSPFHSSCRTCLAKAA
jgi:hypothetical protein